MTALAVATVVQWLPFLLGGALRTLEVVVMALVLGIVCGLAGGLGRLARSRRCALPPAPMCRWSAAHPSWCSFSSSITAFPSSAFRFRQCWPRSARSGSIPVPIRPKSSAAQSSRSTKGSRRLHARVGLSRYQTMRLIVLPQALLRMLPPLGNEFVSLTKNSALVSLVTVRKSFPVGADGDHYHIQNFAVFLTIGVIYYAMTSVVGGATRMMERRLSVYVGRE